MCVSSLENLCAEFRIYFENVVGFGFTMSISIIITHHGLLILFVRFAHLHDDDNDYTVNLIKYAAAPSSPPKVLWYKNLEFP